MNVYNYYTLHINSNSCNKIKYTYLYDFAMYNYNALKKCLLIYCNIKTFSVCYTYNYFLFIYTF